MSDESIRFLTCKCGGILYNAPDGSTTTTGSFENGDFNWESRTSWQCPKCKKIYWREETIKWSTDE